MDFLDTEVLGPVHNHGRPASGNQGDAYAVTHEHLQAVSVPNIEVFAFNALIIHDDLAIRQYAVHIQQKHPDLPNFFYKLFIRPNIHIMKPFHIVLK
jgi:hypothetical protein